MYPLLIQALSKIGFLFSSLFHKRNQSLTLVRLYFSIKTWERFNHPSCAFLFETNFSGPLKKDLGHYQLHTFYNPLIVLFILVAMPG